MFQAPIGVLSAPRLGVLAWLKTWWHARHKKSGHEAIERQVEFRERRYDATILKLFAKKRRRDAD